MTSNSPAVASPAAPIRAPWRPQRRTILLARGIALAAAIGVSSGCGASHHALLAPEPAATELPINYRVEYDSLFQTPRFIQNANAQGQYRPGAPAPFSDSAAFQIVRRFVIRYAPVFHFRPGIDDFVATWAQGQDGENLVKVTQTYHGLPVDAMGYGTSVLPNGEVGTMGGRFMPGIGILTTPLVSSETAASQSVAALDPVTVTVYSPPRLVVTAFASYVPRLTWSTGVIKDFLTWTVFVDAQTGKVLGVRQNFIIG